MADQLTVAPQTTGKTVIGKVISNKMNKTIIVQTERKLKHPLYGKYIKHFSKMCAHDPENLSKMGDIVEIKQTRPLSKTKFWILVKVVEQVEK